MLLSFSPSQLRIKAKYRDRSPVGDSKTWYGGVPGLVKDARQSIYQSLKSQKHRISGRSGRITAEMVNLRNKFIFGYQFSEIIKFDWTIPEDFANMSITFETEKRALWRLD